MIKKIVIAILILGVAGGIYGYYMFNKKNESISSMKTEIKTSASQLLTDFESDEPVANEKYLDKVVEVTGQVSKVESKEASTSVYLDTGNPLSSVICQLEDPSQNVTYKNDEDITVKGICTGYLMDVVLVRSEIIQ